MRFDVVTLFPEIFDSITKCGITARAMKRGLWSCHTWNPRAMTEDVHRTVDDRPFGGGPGMVMMADPLAKTVDMIRASGNRGRVISFAPNGTKLTDERVRRMVAEDESVVLVCGRYEGIDERFIEECVDEEISIGDYILTGGELASLVVADSVLRLKPGVLAEQKGYEEESYWDGLLEYPQYTRPEVWEGRAVPQVLLGGDHQKIDAWRGEQSRTRTRLRRPELYEQWCETHPITELPKWKRGENVRLVKTAEQFAAAAKLFAEGRQAVCADNWTPEYCRTLTEPQFLLQLQQEKAAGWVCYLHTTKDVPDGMVCVSHKAGHIEHLFVTEKARGNGIGAKLLDFARKKLPEHAHPVLSVLNTNTRAIALYTRMGWQLDGSTSLEFDPKQYPTVTRKCALVQMRYAGPAQE